MAIAVIAGLTAVAAAAITYLADKLIMVVALSCVWPLFYLGVAQAWWGSGLGDGWWAPASAFTAAALLGAIVGLGARRARR
jgi:hypothetical protein